MAWLCQKLDSGNHPGRLMYDVAWKLTARPSVFPCSSQKGACCCFSVFFFVFYFLPVVHTHLFIFNLLLLLRRREFPFFVWALHIHNVQYETKRQVFVIYMFECSFKMVSERLVFFLLLFFFLYMFL
jgi:hypothetical protein